MKRLLSHIAPLLVVFVAFSFLANGQTFPNVQQEIRLFNTASSNYIGLTSPSALGTTYNLILPSSQGATGSILTNNGSGTLSWTTILPVANGGTGASTLTGVLIGNGTSAITGTTLSSGIAGAITDETGSGALVFATNPTVTTLVVSSGGAAITGTTTINTTGTAATTIGNTGSSVTIGSLAGTAGTSVGSSDRILIANSSGLLSQASISTVVAAGVSGSAWSLTGNNIGTSSGALGAAPTGSFLGTTAGNTQPLNIVTNNAIRMIVSSDGVVSTEKDIFVNGHRVGKGVAGSSGTVVLGASALASPTVGVNNTALGVFSLAATTGESNTAAGFQAGYGLTTGNKNVLLGNAAGHTLTAGSENVFIGWGANLNSGSVNRSITIGASTSSGSNSVTIGYLASGSSKSVVIGDSAQGESNSIAIGNDRNENVAAANTAVIGRSAITLTRLYGTLRVNTIAGTAKTSLGSNDRILVASNDGSFDQASISTVVAAGISGSAWSLTGNNIGTSSGALGAAPTGSFLGTTSGNTQPLNIVTNNAIRMIVSSDGVVNTEKDIFVNGHRVGKGVAGSSGTVVLGASALASPTVGVNNTALGVFSLAATTGANNTAAGFMAGYGLTTGIKNVVLGNSAGFTLAAGSENVFIGFGANLNNGAVNQAVVIGGPAAGGSNSVVIGYNAQGGSNSIAIGNDLNENVAASNTAIIGRSAITLTQLYGTLQVNTIAGTAKTSLGLNDRILVASSDGSFDQASISTVVAAGVSGSAWSLSGNSISDPTTQFLGTTSAQPLVIRTNNTEKVRVTSNGNVGIGANNPSAALTVMGSANTLLTIGGNLLPSNLQWTPAATEKVAIFSGASGYATLVMADNGGEAAGRVLGSVLFGQTLSGKSGNNPVGLKGGIQMFSTGSGGAVGGFGSYMSLFTSADNGNGYTERLRIGSTGHVGIGTGLAMPGARLHVGGGNVLIDTVSAGTAGQLQFRNPAATFTTSIQAGAQTANITYTLPTAAPTVNNQVLTSTTAGVMSWATALTSASGWSTSGNTGTDSTSNYIGTQAEATGRPLIMRTNGVERMRITGGSGFVGIGTSGPTAQLQVNPSSAAVVGLNVRAASAQTANLVTIGNSAGTNVLQIGPTGNVNIGPFLAETGAADQPLRVLAMQTSVTGATEKDLFIGQVDHIGQDPSFRLSLSNYNAADVSNARSQLNVKLREGAQNIDQATTILSLRSQGFVGINSSAPSTALDVTGTSTLRPAADGVGLSIRQNTGQSGSLVDVVSSGGTSLLTIGSSGAVTLLPFGTAAGSTNELRFGELAANGSHYVGLKGPNSISANVIWTLPSTDGSNGQVLSTNGTGTLSWVSALTGTSGWSTTGNAGTNSSTNFIGTTDSVDLVFRHNNNERMRMTSGGLRVTQGNGTPRSSIWAASFQNIGSPVYLELLNSDAVTNGGGMYMGMRGTGSVGDTATIWNWQGGPLAFYTNTINRSGLIRLFIDNDGDVGIGSHIPTQRLHVRGGNLLIDTVGNTGTVAGQLQMRNPAGTFQTNIQAGAQTSNITLTLPTSAPTSNGQVLTSTTGGVMSWSNALDGFWSTTGNAGTSPATNFIGTTDAQDVVLSRNSLERLRLTNSGVRVSQNGTPRSSTWALSVQNIFNSGTTNSALIEVLNTTSAVDGGGAHFGLKGTQSVGDTLGIWNFQGGPIKLFTSTLNRESEVRMIVQPNGNVGVGDITPGTRLDVDGGLTVRPGGTTNVTADNGPVVTIGNRSHVVLNSNGTPVNRTITISNGLQTGQIVFIMVTGTAAANGIELADDPAGSNTNLSGNAQLVDGAVLQLIWNGADWMEVTRSNN